MISAAVSVGDPMHLVSDQGKEVLASLGLAIVVNTGGVDVAVTQAGPCGNELALPIGCLANLGILRPVF